MRGADAQQDRAAWKLPRTVALLALGLAVAGCAETKLAVTAAKSLSNDRASSQPPARGVYKIGDPYQINGIWYYPAEDYRYDETGIASWYGTDFHGKYTANGELYDMNDLTAAHHTLPLPSLVRVTNIDNGRQITVRVNDRGPFARGRILDLSRRSAQLLGFEQNGTAKVRVQVLPEESRQLAADMRSRGAVQVASNNAARAYRVDVQPGEAAPVNAPRASVTAMPLAAPSGPAPAAVAAIAAPAALQVASQAVTQTTPKKGSQIFVQAGAFANADNAQRLSVKLQSLGATRVVPVTIGSQQLFRVRLGPLTDVTAGDRALDQVVASGHPEARLVVD